MDMSANGANSGPKPKRPKKKAIGNPNRPSVPILRICPVHSFTWPGMCCQHAKTIENMFPSFVLTGTEIGWGLQIYADSLG